eukprot:gene7350-7279_t
MHVGRLQLVAEKPHQQPHQTTGKVRIIDVSGREIVSPMEDGMVLLRLLSQAARLCEK